MSSATAEIAGDEAAAAVEKAPRRFPSPCWTQEETLALIDAYREQWYARGRGCLRTPDWDTVATAVTSRCPGASPAKTSAQCRHKMEKLRQRYRAEKLRALSFPFPGGRYFSSWFFFENMEAMDNGTTPPASAQTAENSADGSRLNSFLDQNILKLKLKAGSGTDSVLDSGFDHDFVKSRRFDSAATIRGAYSPHLNKEEQQQQEQPMNQIPQPLLKSKGKKSGITFKHRDISHEFHQSDALPPELIPKNLRKLDPNTDSDDNRTDFNQQFWVKYNNHNNSNSAAPHLRPGLKRSRTGVEDIAASIRALGEGFMKMEKVKMEVAREMKEMRMEMEMKRNALLLESQKQIVDAFLKGLLEVKKRKELKSGITAAADPSTQP